MLYLCRTVSLWRRSIGGGGGEGVLFHVFQQICYIAISVFYFHNWIFVNWYILQCISYTT